MLILLGAGVALADLGPSFEERLSESSGAAALAAVVALGSLWAVATFRKRG